MLIYIEKSKCYPRNRLWRPIGLWDVENPILSRQSIPRWRWGCQPHCNNSGHFPSSCLLFKTPLNPIGLSVPHRKHIRSPLWAQQVNAIYRFCDDGMLIYKKSKSYPHNRPWSAIGLSAKDPTLSRQSAHRWRYGYSPTHQPHFTPQNHLLLCFRYSLNFFQCSCEEINEQKRRY
jgi:hypothetical protein